MIAGRSRSRRRLPPPPAPGAPEPDAAEAARRLDEAHERLRSEIPPLEEEEQ